MIDYFSFNLFSRGLILLVHMDKAKFYSHNKLHFPFYHDNLFVESTVPFKHRCIYSDFCVHDEAGVDKLYIPEIHLSDIVDKTLN